MSQNVYIYIIYKKILTDFKLARVFSHTYTKKKAKLGGLAFILGLGIKGNILILKSKVYATLNTFFYVFKSPFKALLPLMNCQTSLLSDKKGHKLRLN